MGKMSKRWFSLEVTVLVLAALFVCVSVARSDTGNSSLPAAHQINKLHAISVPAMNAADALNRLSEQTRTEFLFPYDIALARTTHAVIGTYSVMEALTLMLADSGLSSGLSDKGAIRIFLSSGSSNNRKGKRDMQAKTNILVAAVSALLAGGAAAQNEPALGSWRHAELEEVVVTARKREERLIDVPISIAVISEGEIKDAGIHSMNDLSYFVPNLSVVEESSGRQRIAIRGVGNVVGSSPLVGIYLDEMPVSIIPNLTVDLQAADVERLEVLRGPQGTLYGQGSVGGAIRFVTNRPSFEGVKGELGVAAYDTKGGGPGFNLRTVVNIPVLEDELAFRVAATYADDGGWIDQPASNSKDNNDSETENIRLKALWQISDVFTVDSTIVRHRNDAGGYNWTNVGSVTSSNYKVVAVDGMDLSPTDIRNDYELYNLTLNYDFHSAILTSSSSMFDAKNKYLSSSLAVKFAFDPETDYEILETNSVQSVKGFSQEVRLSGENHNLKWVFGAFYSDVDETNTIDSNGFYVGGIPAFGPGTIDEDRSTYRFSESAALFGNLSYDVSEKVTLGVGTRYFQEKTTFEDSDLNMHSEEFDNVSSKVSLTYDMSDAANIYVSIAEGFRSGGFNPGSETSYDPETVLSYEVGAKAGLLDGRLNAEGAIFLSEYSDYQNRSFDPLTGENPILNPGEAEIRGVELSVQWAASENGLIGASGNITEAEFTKIDPLSSGFLVGDAINLIPEYSYSIFVNHKFNWTSDIVGFSRVDYNRQGPNSYINRGIGILDPIDKSSSIGLLNAQVGAQWKNLSVRLIGRNLNNELRSTNADIASQYVQNRPRSLGFDINYTF